MKRSALKYGILSVTAGIITFILLLMPFHAFLTVWLGSNFGHYTAIRLWKEALLAVAALGALYLLVFDKKTRLNTLYHELTWLIAAYFAVQLIWGSWAWHHHAVTAKALGYGLIVNLRFLMFFLCAWVIGSRTKRLAEQWSKVLLWPAVIVIVFALVQEAFLTPRFLEHFGYSKYTILPFQYVNNNPNLLRVQSTLRGANPLGAYLLVPLSGLLVLMNIGKRNWRRGLMLLGIVLALFFSFSRAAWIGALLSLLVVVFAYPNHWLKRRWLAYGLGGLAVIGAVLIIGFRHNAQVENIVLHTQTHSAVKTTSNGNHVSALRAGIHDAVHEPVGRGPGTAGPASVYNSGHPSRIAEDYYVQIAQEVGWLGLVMFITINIFVALLLWRRRADPLALSLLASLIGISFVNLLSHAWADDTLAYLWWGLAGIAIGTGTKSESGKRTKQA